MTEPSSGRKERDFIDRRQNRGGIREGGRRKSDRGSNNSSRIWFGLSLLVTALIMAWTVSIPFRSEKPMFAFEKPETQVFREAQVPAVIEHHPEHVMSNERYISYAMDLEDELQEQIADRNFVPSNLPGQKHAQRESQERRKLLTAEFEQLRKMEKEQDARFDPESIEGQKMQAIRKLLESEG